MPAASLQWLIPVFFLILSGICYSIPGHSFLGLIFFGLACVSGAWLGFALLKDPAGRILRRILVILVSIGVGIVAVTEIPILLAARGDAGKTVECIIVLGAGVRGSEPSLILQSRIDAACQYLIDHPKVICVASGGQGPDEDLSEAQCIRDHLVAAGIGEDRILLEDRSTSTWENFRFSMAVLEEKYGSVPKTVGVLSSEFHLFRASIFARKCGITPVGIPAKTPWLTLQLNYFLREAAGIWHYIILGG